MKYLLFLNRKLQFALIHFIVPIEIVRDSDMGLLLTAHGEQNLFFKLNTWKWKCLNVLFNTKTS